MEIRDHKTNNPQQEQLNIILDKMFSYVGIRREDVNTQKENWYLLYEWTPEQEHDFINWLTNYIKTNKEAKKLFSTPFKNKHKECALFFVANYGWKTKQA
jgi:hypothetical protein